jgi:hypothetical protein
VAGVAGRNDLANPIRHDVNGTNVPRSREAVATPSRQVRPHDVVRRQSNVDLEEDHQPPGTARAVVVVERPANESPEFALHAGVSWQRGGRGDQHAADDLCLDAFGQGAESIPSRQVLRGLHLARIARVEAHWQSDADAATTVHGVLPTDDSAELPAVHETTDVVSAGSSRKR